MDGSNSLLFQTAALGIRGVEPWCSRCYQNVSFSKFTSSSHSLASCCCELYAMWFWRPQKRWRYYDLEQNNKCTSVNGQRFAI